MNPPRPISRSVWFWSGLLLTALKLWLTRAQPVYAIGPAVHDDRLFLLLAESIVQGQWLGPYSQMTLAKGPFYSIWVATLFTLGIPFGLGVQLAYAGACALLARALRPAIHSGATLLAIYLFLLWNPMSFEGPTLGRVIRQQIYTPLELGIFAGLIALYARRSHGLRQQLPWALLAGFSFGCFWLAREESIWIIPSVMLLAAGAVYWAYRSLRGDGPRMIKSLAVAVLSGLLPIGLVSLENYREYHWFGTCEIRSSEFKDAYGAMVRVKVGPNLPFVAVTRQAREAMYAVSPTFALLQPYFEGEFGTGWAEASTGMTRRPADERQIGSGWQLWALRDCAAAAGYHQSAHGALNFYRRMADEINQACDDGRLPAHPRRSGFLPIWKDGQWRDVVRTVWDFTDFVVSYKSFAVQPPPSIGTDDDVLLFRDLTRDRLTTVPAGTNFILPTQAALDSWKLARLRDIGEAQRPLLRWVFILTHPLALVCLVVALIRRQLPFPLLIAAAAWGGSLAYLLINAIVQVTSFNVISVSTFWPIYPLLQIFTVAVIWDAATAWRGQKSH